MISKNIPIRIGDIVLFRTYDGKKNIVQKALVYQVDNENWFHISALLENTDREAVNTRAGGDITRKMIENVVEHWDADRVLNALKTGGEITGFQWPEEEFARIRKEMEKTSHKETL